MIPEGKYPGVITSAWLERDDQWQSDALVMCFAVDLTMPDGSTEEVTPRHATSGEFGWSGKQVAKLLELEWPAGLREIDSTSGVAVQVRIKHKTSQRTGDTYVNAYIATPPVREAATADQIEHGIAKLEAEAGDDNIPF